MDCRRRSRPCQAQSLPGKPAPCLCSWNQSKRYCQQRKGSFVHLKRHVPSSANVRGVMLFRVRDLASVNATSVVVMSITFDCSDAAVPCCRFDGMKNIVGNMEEVWVAAERRFTAGGGERPCRAMGRSRYKRLSLFNVQSFGGWL